MQSVYNIKDVMGYGISIACPSYGHCSIDRGQCVLLVCSMFYIQYPSIGLNFSVNYLIVKALEVCP